MPIIAPPRIIPKALPKYFHDKTLAPSKHLSPALSIHILCRPDYWRTQYYYLLSCGFITYDTIAAIRGGNTK
jgi:hypothetical protein